MSNYEATIKGHLSDAVGVVADFIVYDKEKEVGFELDVINGDFEDRDDLYICPADPSSSYDDDGLMVVYLYDVLSYEKYVELQKNVFDNDKNFVMELDVEKDLEIIVEEYMNDELASGNIIVGKSEQKKVRKHNVSKDIVVER